MWLNLRLLPLTIHSCVMTLKKKKTSIMHKYYLCKSDCPYRCCDVVQKQQLYINLLHYSSIVTTAMIDRQSVDLLDIYNY